MKKLGEKKLNSSLQNLGPAIKNSLFYVPRGGGGSGVGVGGWGLGWEAHFGLSEMT